MNPTTLLSRAMCVTVLIVVMYVVYIDKTITIIGHLVRRDRDNPVRYFIVKNKVFIVRNANNV